MEFESFQDVVGQLPFLKTYSHLLLAFPILDDVSSRREIADCLSAASLRLTNAFPWLAAKVVQRRSDPGTTGTFVLEPCSLWSAPNCIIRFKDCSDDSPSFKEIIKTRGPASLLDGAMLAPRKAFPESYHETEENPAPVIAFQANFIRGGLLLDCAAQHNFIDMNGIEQCYNLLATALRGEPFSKDAIKHGNLDRRSLVPLLEPHETMQDHQGFTCPEPWDLPPPPVEPGSPFSWRYFRFSPVTLAKLKEIATTGSDGTLPYVSTNDALTAFCWQRIISARLRRRKTPHAVAKFCRAVDARKAMGVPQGYMGDLVTIATSKMSFQDLARAPLADVASQLRRDLMHVNNRDYIRSFATFIAQTRDKSKISYGGRFNTDTDIGCSSWARVQLAKVSFGPLGKPSLIRRPDFGPLKSDIYLMPQTEDGAIDALLCFNDLDFNGLMEDELWKEHADYIQA
ncbi:transferase family-domain-containing protein [Hypoxylon argillaceum]|nr:transferase family-domain-containing protein [Hypoxylon argillaceum]